MLNTANTKYFANYWWFLISALILCCDQLSKLIALHYLSGIDSLVVTPFFNLTLLFNRGAAFSFLSQANGWQHILFGVISMVVCFYCFYIFPRINPGARLYLIALSLIVGGALGNSIDRLHYGYVIDFLHFHLFDWHFAVFNLADSAITIGAGLLILSLIREN